MAKDKDLGDPEVVQQEKQKADTREKRIANGLTLVLSHADSRLWLYSMLEEAGPFQETFATNSSLTAYRSGQQAWAKRLVAQMLDTHLDQYIRLMKENRQD